MKSLHAKIALALLAVLLILGTIHFFIHQLITYPSFVELERREARHDAARIVTILEREKLYLDATCKDWAYWDDTYAFARDHNPLYIAKNLHAGTFASNRLSLIAFLDPQGALVWSAGYDWRHATPLAITLPWATLAVPTRADQAPDLAGRSGLLMTAAGPLLLTARSILPSNSNSTAPPHGTLLMGRLLDSAFLDQLQAEILVPFHLIPLQPTIPAGVTTLRRLNDSGGSLLEVKDADTLTATVLFNDLFERPALLIQADLPREISTYGLRTAGFALYFFWGSAGVVFVLLILLLRHIILQPMHQLTGLALAVRQQGDLSLRVDLPRQDEVGTLAAAFNRMLDLIETQTVALATANRELTADGERLRLAEEALRNLDRMKNEFISAAAHELNTPLTAIMGYTELLVDPESNGSFTPEQQREFLTEILARGEALEKVIADLLDVSHFESGQPIHLNLAPLDPAALLTRLLRRYRHLAPQHHFTLELADAMPEHIAADAHRLTQVLENLLSNAVKYSPPGSTVRLSAARRADTLCIVVADNGIGMTTAQLERVFEKFYRADAGNTAVRGLGLGMSIVKRIVEAHLGQIALVSAPGAGTTVTVTLPC